MATRECCLYRSQRMTVAIWNVWWWWHVERGESCTTYYIGPFVVCKDRKVKRGD